MRWIEEAYPKHKTILRADTQARWEAGDDVTSDVYYTALWEATHELFLEQVLASTADLASLFYTAWVNAGKPDIPPPPTTVSHASIFPRTTHATSEGSAEVGTLALVAAAALAGIAILGISIRRGLAKQR